MSASDQDAFDHVWIVIPAFREARIIRVVVRDVRASFRNVVVVDDGSPDDTARQAATGGAIVLRHAVNLGQGAALQTGIEFALRSGAEYIATFDADGQHEITDVRSMFCMIQRHRLDVVLGSRFIGRADGISASRRMLLRAAVLFTRWTTGLALTDAHNGLRLFTRTAAQSIQLSQNRMAHASEILEQIAKARMKYVEFGNTVRYSDYSRAKGQKTSNAINIVIDLLLERLKR